MFLPSFLCVMLLKENSYIVIMDYPVRYGVQNQQIFYMFFQPIMHGLKAQKRPAQGKRSDTLGVVNLP